MTCPNPREESLKRVQQLAFMTDDLRLFLDTHPCSEEALAALKRYIMLEAEAVAQKDNYDWACGPWPWERED